MKPGYRTTEFWTLIATFLGAGLGAVSDQMPAEYATAAVAISTACYAISRGLAKRAPAAPPAPPATPPPAAPIP